MPTPRLNVPKLSTRALARLGVLIAAVLVAGVVVGVPAASAADFAGPAIGSPSIALSNGPTAEPGEKVTVTVTATDPSGVAGLEAEFYHQEDGNMGSGPVKLGRVNSDTWVGTWTIPNLVLPGTWSLVSIWGEDASPMANQASIYPDGQAFTITNPLQSDFAGPAIGSPSIALSNGPTAEPGEKVTVTVTATDPSGVAGLEAEFYHQEDGNMGSGPVKLGRVNSDTWVGTWTIPNLVLPGTWSLVSIWGEDASPMANQASIYPDGQAFTITNPLQSDFAGPAIGSPSIALSNGPTAEPGEKVTVTVTATDPSGVAGLEAEFYHQEDGNMGSGPVKLGRVNSDTWVGTWTIPNLVLPGTWSLVSIWGEDASPMANQASIYPDGQAFTITQGKSLASAVPTITGTAKVGSVLTAKPGVWGPAPVTLKYQWRVNGAAISGATGTSYKIAAGAAGKKITVTVTGSKSGYYSATKTSAATATVARGSLTPAPTPKISGIAKVGYTLKAAPGTWGPAPVTLKYQWRVNGAAISGATGTSYKIAAGAAGKKITVTVTGSKSGYYSATKTSAATATVARGSLTPAPTPKISGIAKVGYTLKAAPGTWGPAPVTLKYQWRVNGAAISGASGTSYKIAAGAAGKKITVTVTGSKTGYNSAVRTSAATALVT